MHICRDKLTKALQEKKYNVVRLPRDSIQPLCVYALDAQRTYLGKLDDLFVASEPKGEIALDDGPASEISIYETDSMRISAAMHFVAHALGVEPTDANLEAGFKTASRLQVRFQDVRYRRAKGIDIGTWLHKYDLRIANPFVRQFLVSDSNAIIVTEILCAKSVVIDAQDSSRASVAVDLDALSRVRTQFEASRNTEGHGGVVYKGKVPVTFAFKALRLEFDEGTWTVHGVSPRTDLASGSQVEPAPMDVMDPWATTVLGKS